MSTRELTRAGVLARVKAATLTLQLVLQGNVENVLNRKYVTNADSNTNISPGAPRTVRVALTAKF